MNPTKDKADFRRKLTIDQEKQLVDKYQTSMLTTTDLGKIFGCSGYTALETLKRYGIRRRKRGTKLWTEEERARLSARVKRDWIEKRDTYLAGVRKVSWRPDGRILELRLTIPARRHLTKLVIGRDKKCVRCGSTHRLHIHHIKAIQERPDLAMEPSNCETLCNKCHASEEARRRWV